jgi:hypothetical protein
MFLVGNVSAYLSQSVYFIRSVQGKDSGKNQALTFLMQSERNEVWWANYPKANEA